VIVAEPAEIAAEEPHGARLLFVALTRAVQHLALAHAQPLPEVLALPAVLDPAGVPTGPEVPAEPDA
jgi:hypothetical protein